MILDLGIVEPGSTVYLPFHTFDSNDPTASVTLTGLAVTDVEVYKDGGTTQRASDNGYTLLDTDGIDFDGTTGIHGLSISLADNSTAGFWAAGSKYFVVIASITVDAATVNFVLATFTIGYRAAVLNTTIASLSSQTSFTLTDGPAEDDALNGMWCIIHDVASAVQKGQAIILDYTGSTKTVTLAAGTTFTAAATDNISVMGPAPLQPATAGRQLIIDANQMAYADCRKWLGENNATPTTAGVPEVDVTFWLGTAAQGASGRPQVDVELIEGGDATDAITAAVPTAAAIADAVLDEDMTGHQTQGSLGQAIGDPGADSDSIWSITNAQGATGTGLSAIPWNAAWDAEVQSEVADGLAVYDPPTHAELTTAVGAVTLADGPHGGANSNITLDFFQVNDFVDFQGAVTYGGAFTATSASNDIRGIGSFTAAGKAELQQEATDALNAYDPPTNAEMDARTLAAASYATAAAQSTAQTDLTQIKADLPTRITKNTELVAFPFKMVLSSDHITAATGKTVTATRSIDGAAFGACANSVAETSNGWYKITLAAADLNGNTIALRFTEADCDDRDITIVTQP